MLTWINDLFEQEPDAIDPPGLSTGLMRALRDLLRECEQLYYMAAQRCLYEFPDRVPRNLDNYEELMRDLHRGVLIKTLIVVAHCDRHWSPAERQAAVIVMRHVWKVEVTGAALAKALQNIIDHSERLKWEDLLKPFVEIPELHEEAESLRAIILRLANLIAKADGTVMAAELKQLEQLKKQLQHVFTPQTTRTKRPAAGPIAVDSEAAKIMRSSVATTKSAATKSAATDGRHIESKTEAPARAVPSPEQRRRMCDEALKELNSLIGLESLKTDVEQLVNFLKVQRFRKEHELPTAEISFHAVFEGNPGTGKTTVARILSRLLCGLEILEKGQTIELDRSGLVAQYAGQTGPRTNERVDEALGGVLFIDEAYSLMSDQGEDTFGTEAVQTLLKRMEDDRDQFVVVLAGYPQPMQRMLRTNPGLSSRFQRTYRFEDYDARDLLRIYYKFCKKYHYRLPKSTQQKLLAGFKRLIASKDEHFGNGRLARNLFENSIRHMSTRIVDITPITRELLTTIEPDDILFDEHIG